MRAVVLLLAVMRIKDLHEQRVVWTIDLEPDGVFAATEIVERDERCVTPVVSGKSREIHCRARGVRPDPLGEWSLAKPIWEACYQMAA